MAATYYAKILLKIGSGYPGTVLELGEAGYDTSANKFWMGNGIGSPPTGITMDPSFNELFNIVLGLESSIGGGASQIYVDGSLNNIRATYIPDASLSNDFIWNGSYLEVSLGAIAGLDAYATNASVNLYAEKTDASIISLQNADKTFATNASVGIALGPYATNASVGLAIQNFATNSSVGLALQPYATNASIGLAGFAKQTYVDGSLNNIKASYIPNSSLGLDFYWQSGLLEVSLGSILSLGKNLTLDSSGNIALANSINLSGDVSIQGNLFVDQRERFKDYTLSNASTGDLWWQSPRLFFRDGSENRDILQGSLKGLNYPSSPSEGDMFYRSDIGLLFVYDGSRGKYLSAGRSNLNGGRTTAVAGSTVYLRVGDATQSSTAGYRMIRNGTVTGFSVDNNNTLTAARDIQLRINDTVQLTRTIAIGQKGFNYNQANVDFNAGDIIQVSALAGAIGSALNNWIIVIEFATRA